jgi:hypothetical protein
MADCPTCGSPQKPQRSSADHRRLFALIAAAFHQWPEANDFQPEDAEQLRSWLLCKAGFCEKTPIECPDSEAMPGIAQLIALACESVLRAANGRGFLRVYGERIIVFTPRSIAWDRLDQKAFADIRDRVTGVIESELNIKAETLLKEYEAMA